MSRRTVVGIPKFASKPPVRRPCTEQVIYGELLTDDDFEVTPTGFGSGGEDFPLHRNTLSCYWDNSDGAFAYQVPGSLQWAFENNTGVPPEISTSSPYSGARHVLAPDPDNDLLANNLVAVRMRLCVGADANGNYRVVTGRINPGDTVTTSCYMKVGTTDQGVSSQLIVEFYRDSSWNYSFDSQISSETALTTTYAKQTLTGTAPADAYYIVARFGWFQTSPGTTAAPVYLDRCSVIVS